LNCETKTLDNVFLTIRMAIQYHVILEQAYDAYYKLSNPHQQIAAYVYNVVRSTVPRLKIDSVFEQKDDIATAIRDELEKIMHAYGYHIVQALVTDIEPDRHVKEAMNQINAVL